MVEGLVFISKIIMSVVLIMIVIIGVFVFIDVMFVK